METKFMRLITRFLFHFCIVFTIISASQATEYSELNGLFDHYDHTIEKLVRALVGKKWHEALAITQSLTDQSRNFLDMGRKNKNPTWTYYASNLFHHCLELEQIVGRNDGVAATYIVAILIDHIAQVQSSNPYWLRQYLNQQVATLEAGLAKHNHDAVRNAAEIIHTSANKIVLSISSAPKTYRHTYWKSSVVVINKLGDDIIGEVNQNDWSLVPGNLNRIKHALQRWNESFYTVEEETVTP